MNSHRRNTSPITMSASIGLGSNNFRKIEHIRKHLVGQCFTGVSFNDDALFLQSEAAVDIDHRFLFCLYSPWQVTTQDGVVAGVGQLCVEDDKGSADRVLNRIRRLISMVLFNRLITNVDIDGRSNDLIITVEGGHKIRTFTVEATGYYTWRTLHILGNKRREVVGGPKGLKFIRATPFSPRSQANANH